jgi:hypothetical protein
MELKKCTCCNLEFPKTEDYFLLKPKRKNYRWKVNEIYRSNCKKCWYQKTSEQRILKRCNELGIKRSEWGVWKREDMLKKPIFQMKDERLKDFERPLRSRILKKIREENYVFTTIENYYKDCSKNISKAQRKYSYSTTEKLNSNIITNEMLDHDIVKSITLVADKINKNNVNILEYKKITKHKKDIDFFE